MAIAIESLTKNFTGRRSERNSIQSSVMPYIYRWAETVPNSPMGIVDLGAGTGIETIALNQRGYRCTGIEPGINMGILESVISFIHPDKNRAPIIKGSVTALPFADRTISGALLKDVLVLLAPKQREEMLLELRHKLVSGGSFLVISEYCMYSAAFYTSNQGRIHAILSEKDCGSYVEWLKAVEKLRIFGDSVYCMEYTTTPDILHDLAKQNGFMFSLIKEYEANELLALENRWTQNPGFIARLDMMSKI